MEILTKEIDVLFLCGGLGKRLRSVVSNKPKSMAEIGRSPFLDILFHYFAGFGFRRFILCTGYKADIIKKRYKMIKRPYRILFSHEAKSLGTAGAIKNAQPLIKSNTFMVLNSDCFCPINLKKFLEFHFRKKAALSIVVTQNRKCRDFGLIHINHRGEITGFEEKKSVKGKHFVSAGTYLFQKEILSLIPRNINYSLEYSLFPSLIGSRFYGYSVKEGFIDIGTPERYEKAKKILRLDGCSKPCLKDI